MANTFDIRFTRSGGLGAFLEAPANSFRWKGVGRLSIDAEGISIAVRRGLLSLFSRSRRVAAADLNQVLREGQALRVEFRTSDAARAVVPFWVRDANTAQQIVRLLPTTRTVELEHDAAGIAPAGFRPDWRALIIFAGVLGLATFGVVEMRGQDEQVAATPAAEINPTPGKVSPAPAQSTRPPPPSRPTSRAVPVPAAQPLDETASWSSRLERNLDYLDAPPGIYSPYPMDSYRPVGAQESPSVEERARAAYLTNTLMAVPRIHAGEQLAAPVDGIVAIVPGIPVYPLARRTLDRFMTWNDRILSSGTPTVDSWWTVTLNIYYDPAFQHPDLWPMRDMELAIASAWRDYLRFQGDANERDFLRAFAERLTERLELYVR